jgi:regulator of protease activity HflC (stomatin/prohibitin superfamily)
MMPKALKAAASPEVAMGQKDQKFKKIIHPHLSFQEGQGRSLTFMLKGAVKKLVIAAVIFILLIIFWPVVIIPAGERGVVLTWGAVQGNIMGEGLHFIVPVMQSVKKLDVKTEKKEVNVKAYSKDIQTVDATVALNYHLDPSMVNRLWQEIGADYESRIIDPSIQESVKAATALFTAQELIELRPKVKDEIKTQLFNRLGGSHITVDDFSIVNFDFSAEYEKAVEAKQVSQQAALKAENDLKRIKTEAEQRVAQATAEATAIKIQAEAITQQGGKEYVSLKAIEKWNGILPTQMIPNATLPFIDLTK